MAKKYPTKGKMPKMTGKGKGAGAGEYSNPRRAGKKTGTKSKKAGGGYAY